MARFSGDWEREFRPQWEIAKVGGQVGGASNPKNKLVRIYLLLCFFKYMPRQI